MNPLFPYQRVKRVLCGATVLSVSILAPLRGTAANDTWTGGGAPDGNWQNANNWGGTAPVAGDFLNFDTSTQNAATNNFANGTIFGNLGFNSTAGAFTLSPVLGGDTSGIILTNCAAISTSAGITGGSISNLSSSTEIIALPVTYSAGNHIIATASGAGALDLSGTFARSSDATVQFVIAGGAINYTGSGLANDGSSGGGIIGGWATTGATGGNAGGLAALSSGNVGLYSGATSESGNFTTVSGSNFKVTQNNTTTKITQVSGSSFVDMNTLVWAPSSAHNETIEANTAGDPIRLGVQGAIMNLDANNVTLTIGGGSTYFLTAGGPNANTAGELSIYSAPFTDSNARQSINSVIENNGTGVVTVNVYGGMTFAQADTYSGGTYINAGYLWGNNAASFGTGPVYVAPGSEVILNKSGGSYGNNFFINGFGGVDDPIALRDSSGATLTGTITLQSTASLAAAGNSTTLNGAVTGNGGLYVIGSYANASLHLGSSTPNTYTGNTTIDANGIGNDTGHSITIWVNNPTHNNLMPNGAGTGNLIMSGGGSALAELDLGGTTQTINGLVSSNTASETLVTSNPGGGVLKAGGNNVTSEYDGLIGTNGSQGTANISLTKIGTGTLTLGGACNYFGTTTISNGVLSLNGSGSISSSTNIFVTSGGTFDVSQNSFTLGNGQNLNGSGLVNGAVNTATGSIITPGAGALSINNGLTLNTGSTVNFQLGATPATGALNQLSVSGSSLALNGGTIAVSYSTLSAGRYKLMTYSAGESGAAANMTLICPVSGNLTGALDDSISGEIDLVVTAGLINLVWKGDGTANVWDVNTTSNWLFGASGYLFTNGDAVVFNDSGSKSPAVNLSGSVAPVSLVVSNNTGTYTFSGGNITGGTSLVKKGSGTLVLTEGGDNFVGGLVVSNGALVIDNDSSGITGGANVTAGATLQLGNNDGSGLLPSGTVNANGTLVLNHPDNITIGNTISGAGTISTTNSDTVTLSAINSFAGNISIQNGTVQGWTQNSLGTTNGIITVANGGTLDHGWDRTKAIVVAGAGVGGNGAIVNNSSGNAIYDGSGGGMSGSLTLTGNTTFGGSTRWDLGYPCTLSTGGNNYNLTINEASGVYMEWDNVVIDTNLGNVDVYTGGGGSLGIKGCGASLGNPTNTITVHTGSTLTFWGETTNNSGYAKNIYVQTGGSLNFRPQNPNVYYNTALSLDDGSSWTMINGSSNGTVMMQPVQLNGFVHLEVGDSTVTVSNVISGPGGFYWDNFNNTLVLTATNTYAGLTDIRSARTLSLAGNGSIAGSSNILLEVAGATVLVTNRVDQTLTLASGQTLSGFGVVNGNLTGGSGSTLSPGTNSNLGTLTVTNGNITLSGTTAMKLVETSLSSDLVRATSAGATINYGGTLNVTNLNGVFAFGDGFKLFNATNYTGSFAVTNLPALSAGQVWNWSPASGTLTVVSPVNTSPTNITFSVSGNVLTLSWPSDHIGWRLQVQTNSLSTGLGNNWVDVSGATSVDTVTVTNNPATGAVFYRMVYP